MCISINDFEQRLLSWYEKNKRQMPWRKKDASPYEVFLSETMLQQTQVDKVKGYYGRFLARFPSLSDLAEAKEEEVLKLWEGLGYYSRARNLLKAARAIQEKHGGSFPEDKESLLSLPGTGEYTSSAILAIAFHKREIAVDGNLIRVFSRLEKEGENKDKKMKEKCRLFFLDRLKDADPSDFNQALMDLGEMICLPHGMPHCHECPLSSFCRSKEDGSMLSYPPKKEKNIRKVEKRTVLLIRQKDKILIRKRPDRGLLASLYEFPNYEGFLNETEIRDKLSGLDIEGIHEIGKGKHVFSHLVWEMKGYEVAVKNRDISDEAWISKEKLFKDCSIPSAFRFVLRHLI